MHDQCLFGGDLVETGQGGDRLAGQVHVGHRLQQPQISPAAGDPAEELSLRRQRHLQCACELVNEPEADIVPVVCVFAAGVAEADDQAGW
jgi:hypothetical protein